jgi:hypothetical protein
VTAAAVLPVSHGNRTAGKLLKECEVRLNWSIIASARCAEFLLGGFLHFLSSEPARTRLLLVMANVALGGSRASCSTSTGVQSKFDIAAIAREFPYSDAGEVALQILFEWSQVTSWPFQHHRRRPSKPGTDGAVDFACGYCP